MKKMHSPTESAASFIILAIPWCRRRRISSRPPNYRRKMPMQRFGSTSPSVVATCRATLLRRQNDLTWTLGQHRWCGCFLATPAAVLSAADHADPIKKKGQVCEANFFVAEYALLQNKKDEALRLYQLAASHCPPTFIEAGAAKAALGRRP